MSNARSQIITRFAPSPTGRLHLGHAYSALFAYKKAKDADGRFLLRIEDIDITRCKPEFEQGIFEDLKWLGMNWEEPVRRQSDNFNDYKKALGRLQEMGLLYPCFCTRKEIREEIERSGIAPHGPEGHLYPGTCRSLTPTEQESKIAEGTPYAFRLDMAQAIAHLQKKEQWPLTWFDYGKGEQVATPEILGDVVLARKDVNTSYHLSVTLDDHLQGVTLVTRGMDLFYATHLHRMLQALLELDVPEWHHHELLLDEEQKRFAKRNQSVTLQNLREEQRKSPGDIMDMVGLHLGLFLATLLLHLFVLSTPLAAFAAEQPAVASAESENTVEKNALNVIENDHKRHYVSLAVENDSIGGGTDRNYTSGVRLSYFNVNAEIPEFIRNIADQIPTFSINPTTSIFWSAGQNLYTPKDISSRVEDPTDRPWAAWLYTSAGLSTITDNHVDELELTLGVIGPAALGEQTQKFVHSIVNSPDPKGWKNQLDNEPGVVVSWRRRWPTPDGLRFLGMRLTGEPNINVSLGNIYTYAGSGYVLRLAPDDLNIQDTPLRVRPSLPGTGYFSSYGRLLNWGLFAGIETRAIARNIFLDGNTFDDDGPSIDKNYFVADFNAGASVTIKDLRVSYGVTYRTKEFKGQDKNDLFGGITLSFRY